jgi:hypothetical protein
MKSFKSHARKPTTALASVGIAPVVPMLSLVEVKDAARKTVGLAPAPPENLIASCVDYGFQEYSSDAWIVIQLVRIVHELPDVPPWVKLLTAFFGIGAGLQGVVDVRDGLAGHPRAQGLPKFLVPKFQFPNGITFPTIDANVLDSRSRFY